MIAYISSNYEIIFYNSKQKVDSICVNNSNKKYFDKIPRDYAGNWNL